MILDYVPADASYSELGYIAPNYPRHGALKFRYTPMIHEQRGKLRAAFAQGDEEYFPVAANEIMRFLREWDLKAANGNPVAITPEAIRRYKGLDKLIDMIAGYRASDIDPDWPAELKGQVAQLSADAAVSRELPGDVREESHLKNSGAASA